MNEGLMKCKDCKGSGKYLGLGFYAYENCRTCEGAGWVANPYYVPPRRPKKLIVDGWDVWLDRLDHVSKDGVLHYAVFSDANPYNRDEYVVSKTEIMDFRTGQRRQLGMGWAEIQVEKMLIWTVLFDAYLDEWVDALSLGEFDPAQNRILVGIIPALQAEAIFAKHLKGQNGPR